MTRALGVDLGSVRIGLASSDATGTLASPLRTMSRAADEAADHRAIVDAALELGAGTIVIGLPRSLDGSLGPAARAVLAELEKLRPLARAAGIEVDTYDERFSTVSAEYAMRDARVGPKRRRAQVDAAAATVILQSWLESKR